MPNKTAHRGISPDDWNNWRDGFGDFFRAFRFVIPALVLFGAIIFGATLGYLALGWPLADALYMVVISVFSVGYGEVQPIDSAAERIWTMIVIGSGWVGVVITLGGITKAVTEGEFRRANQNLRARRIMDHLSEHTIICGYGRMGQTLAKELQNAGLPFVIIDRAEERVAQIQTDGFLSFKGDATEETTLEAAGIVRAKFLATVLPQDALNVFITLTARNLSQTITILARGEQPSTERKLRQAGANQVILPAQIGALRIANAITEPEIASLLRGGKNGLDLSALGVEVDELFLHERAHLLGKTVGEVQKLCGGEVMVLGVRRGHEILRNGLESLVLQSGDALIALARSPMPAVLARDVDRVELA